MSWFYVAFKYVASLRKKNWTLEDYPVRIRRQRASARRPDVPPWRAQILNWWPVGLGHTAEEAFDDLGRQFHAESLKGPLPRPGSRAPLKLRFAVATELDRHGDFAYEFIVRVVGIRPFFMSDRSILADFADPVKLEGVHRKIALLHGVDTGAMSRAPLWEVLDLVQKQGRHD